MVFFKNIRLLTPLTVVVLIITFCFLPTINAHAEPFVTGSYSAGSYNDSSYNQGSDAINNSNSGSNVNNTVSTSTSAEINNSSSDNSINSTNSTDESTTTVTNPNPATTTTTNVPESQKPPIDKSATTVGVIIAIGAVVLSFIIAMLLWVKKSKTK